MELFNERNGEIVQAEIKVNERGDVVLKGWCAGPLAERHFGDWDWEYWVTVPAAKKDRLLIGLLHEKYARRYASRASLPRVARHPRHLPPLRVVLRED